MLRKLATEPGFALYRKPAPVVLMVFRSLLTPAGVAVIPRGIRSLLTRFRSLLTPRLACAEEEDELSLAVY
jgi:hypothetical protein